MAERREEAIRLLQAGEMYQAQIARLLRVSEAAVSKWNKKLEEEGPQSLELRKATGRPPKLDQDDKQNLLVKLERGAVAAGYEVDLWDIERVDEVIQEEFEVKYNRNYIYDLLHALKWRLPRKKKIRFSESLSFDYEKQVLRIMYKNNLTGREKDVTITYELSMIDNIIEVLKNYSDSNGQGCDSSDQDEPVWWPKFLPPDEQDMIAPGRAVRTYFHLSKKKLQKYRFKVKG